MKDLSGITFTIPALKKGYREKEFSPVNVVQEVYRRIKRANDNPIWVHLIPQPAPLHSAGMLANHTQKPPYGIPFLVKENNDVANVPTTAGAPRFSYLPHEKAPVAPPLL